MEGEVASSVSTSNDLVPESLLGSEGFKAPRWRTRVTAAERAVQPFVKNDGLSSSNSDLNFKLYEQLSQQLVYDLALHDSHWQVRVAAIESATTILSALRDSLSANSFAENVWGLLATCLDPQPEVQQVIFRCISQILLPSSPHEVNTAVLALCDRFVEATIGHPAMQVQYPESAKSHSGREFSGLDNFPNGQILLSGLTAAAYLQLLPLPKLNREPPQQQELDMVPLLVIVVGGALEDACKRNNRVLVKGLRMCLRCLGSGVYRKSLVSMLNRNSSYYLLGTKPPRTYTKTGRFDEEIADALGAAKLAPSLKALAIAFGAFDAEELVFDFPVPENDEENSVRKSNLGEEDFIVLQHILEVMHVPSVLTSTAKDDTVGTKCRDFLEISSPLLKIVKSILDGKDWHLGTEPYERKLVEDLVLCCATFAGGDGDNVGSVLWTSDEHRELAISLLVSLHNSLRWCHGPGTGLGLDRNSSSSKCISSVVSENLLSLLSTLKEIIKGDSGESGERTSYANGSVDSSIVAAHQMDWIVRQLEQADLESHRSLIIPCLLTALDHFSPEVKRRAMRSFLHVARNMNPKEFRWNKDVILEAVSRSLVGCEDLWPVAVKLAIATVTRCEGSNPRSPWYRQFLGEMLNELERHRDDQARRVIWLQEVTPLMEAMGLVLVAHFSRLLPLLYYWLHAPDDLTCLLALSRLRTVIIYTWPRVPAHIKRFTDEAVEAYFESSTRKLVVDVQSAAMEVLQLLNLCGGLEIEDALDARPKHR
ncbi:TELO2-interacting protein 2 [Marchantia polymorpha subsp. ruderalis]|uniref:Uncharacterized protein n=2 Tax=Marchantia polymorpha TaxID=3197 RepID=A0AAF6AP73_MARPO|nr:hypothetical protein MARPO_0014s0032 [Marchantia polymorpha]PTQ45479.1 hypothetical protein MARPO_0014s0032 [Marchantia polymorpha]BBM98243.1 hypothetical protein Mp_1g11960 [Marchantia polymorpha subsp. ruderalis]BBM98244.1 hypothetical protein Mp_1g11960 [Marchantia polymorpha subsp. ruderalis]|eukprot:PTQ45477.1 hypothetical protein MARPO_0014s0032 [Marchantia polymorpha]